MVLHPFGVYSWEVADKFPALANPLLVNEVLQTVDEFKLSPVLSVQLRLTRHLHA